jgi:hypothetical protein
VSTIIYGASDDLIEVSGDVAEEFNIDGREDTCVALSNGVLVSVRYDDHGYWRINTIACPDDVQLSLTSARGDGKEDDVDGCPGYSDKLEVDGDDEVVWVLCGTEYAR